MEAHSFITWVYHNFHEEIISRDLSQVGTRIVIMAQGLLETFSDLSVWSNI